MKIIDTEFPGLKIIDTDVFGDNRGWFTESYNHAKYSELGITEKFIQDNHSFSAQKGTLRGLHFQTGHMAQSKLVRCVRGSLWDVCVDLRKGSPTFKQWIGVELSADNHKQLFVPKGFAHGFLTLTDDVEIEYKVDAYYSKTHDSGVFYDDPDLKIDWASKLEGKLPILSEKDRQLKPLNQLEIDFEFKPEN